MFNIPYLYPGFNPGTQITNLQQGGPSSHMEIRPQMPVISPSVYNVSAYGLGNMPRQVNQPFPIININAYSNPITVDNLIIDGVGKKV